MISLPDACPARGAADAQSGHDWACPQAAELLIRQWEDDAAVVYDHSTGHTHLVDALAVHLLRELQQGTRLSRAALARSLQGLLPEPRAAEPVALAALVAQGLDTLQALGLARPVPAAPR